MDRIAYTQLYVHGNVNSMLLLKEGGLAAAVGKRLELFNASALKSGTAAYAHLSISSHQGNVGSLASLEEGGLAAGSEDQVDLFDSHAVERGGAAYARFSIEAFGAGQANSVLSGLEHGGLAVANGMFSDDRGIDLFNASAVRNNRAAYAHLSTTGQANCLLLLDGGGLAAGTESRKIDLFHVSAVRQGGAAYAHLSVSGWISSLLSLKGGGIAVGTASGYDGSHPDTDTGQIHLFNASAVENGGAAYTHLSASGGVYAITSLEGGGLAAGTHGGKRGTNEDTYLVDLFDASALESGGAAYAHLRARSWISSLLPLEGGRLAVGQDYVIQVFHTSVLQSDIVKSQKGLVTGMAMAAFLALLIVLGFMVCLCCGLSRRRCFMRRTNVPLASLRDVEVQDVVSQSVLMREPT